MNRAANTRNEVSYRKRPEPSRIVPLSSLVPTDSAELTMNETGLVNSNGIGAGKGTWSPLPDLPTPIEVSPSSWEGLRSRMLASKAIAEVVA